MKFLISAIVFISANMAFANCEHLEAQVIATVKSVAAETNNQCRVQLQLGASGMFNPSIMCPLDIDELVRSGVLTSCNVKVGEQVSGIAYRSLDTESESIYLF